MSTDIYAFLLVTLYLVPVSITMPSTSVNNVPELKLSDTCYKQGYCFEKHENYPQSVVDNLLLQMNITQDKYMPLPARKLNYEENDCAKNVVMDLIYEIVDTNNKVRVVVQSERRIQQLVEVEECLNQGRISQPSTHFSQEILNTFNLHCQQTRIDIRFLVLNEDWTGIEIVSTKPGIPVACSCSLVSDDNYDTKN